MTNAGLRRRTSSSEPCPHLTNLLVLFSSLLLTYAVCTLVHRQTHNPPVSAPLKRQTLILFVYSGSEVANPGLTEPPELLAEILAGHIERTGDEISGGPDHYGNLLFFLREAVKANGSEHYIILLPSFVAASAFPPLPPNAKYVHVAEMPPCKGTLGMLGWLLERQKQFELKAEKYTHFMWVDSVVRGPFLPPYLRQKVHWPDVFLQRLDNQKRLTGGSISCAPVYHAKLGVVANPHVQGYMGATDKLGLSILLQRNALGCYSSEDDSRLHNELGASRAILEAGYNLDALLLRYQGVEWRHNTTWGCNLGKDPTQGSFYDGITVDPFEVLFVKTLTQSPGAMKLQPALKYDSWYTAPPEKRKIHNCDPGPKLRHVLELLKTRGQKALACFNAAFYITTYYDEFKAFSPRKAFSHFVDYGFREGRSYRLLC